MKTATSSRALAGSAFAALSAALCWAAPASAQQAATDRVPAGAEAADARASQQIVVTGTRITSRGFQAPTPVTVISGEQLQLAAPTSLSEGLNQLPEFRNSFVPASTGPLGSAGGGGAFLNLRGLSAKRNLVLLDGRRLPPTSVTGSVAGSTDINVLPQLLISRVDVVTGGASAAYGSDAVSGTPRSAASPSKRRSRRTSRWRR